MLQCFTIWVEYFYVRKGLRNTTPVLLTDHSRSTDYLLLRLALLSTTGRHIPGIMNKIWASSIGKTETTGEVEMAAT